MGLFGAIGGLIGAGLGFLGQRSANRASAKSVEESIAWQREHAHNRYQWQTADLLAAGLNPVLATGLNAGGTQGATYMAQNEGLAAVQGAAAVQTMRLAAREQRNRDNLTKSEIAYNTAKAAKERRLADEIAQKVDSGLYRHQATMYGASARQSEESANLMIDQSKKIYVEMENLYQSRLHTIQSIKHLRQQIAESRTRAQVNTLQQHLVREETRLRSAETQLKHLGKQKVGLDVEILRKELPGAENVRRYHESRGGQMYERYVRPYLSGFTDVIKTVKRR